MKRIAIFASGSGSNAENIIKYFQDNKKAEVVLVLSNNPKAQVLGRATRLGVPNMGFNKQQLNDSTWAIENLKDLRELALKEQDPLVVKVLRLTYEFIEENKVFDVQAQYEEDEEGNEYPIEIEDKDNLLYLLNLLKNAEHKINREEIKDYRTSLKLELY